MPPSTVLNPFCGKEVSRLVSTDLSEPCLGQKGWIQEVELGDDVCMEIQKEKRVREVYIDRVVEDPVGVGEVNMEIDFVAAREGGEAVRLFG